MRWQRGLVSQPGRPGCPIKSRIRFTAQSLLVGPEPLRKLPLLWRSSHRRNPLTSPVRCCVSMAGSRCEAAGPLRTADTKILACVVVACAVLNAPSRAFDDGNAAFGNDNSGGRENKFIHRVCGIAEQMRRADLKW